MSCTTIPSLNVTRGQWTTPLPGNRFPTDGETVAMVDDVLRNVGTTRVMLRDDPAAEIVAIDIDVPRAWITADIRFSDGRTETVVGSIYRLSSRMWDTLRGMTLAA